MELLITICASVAIGVVVGMLSGMLGVGGGMILVPIFKLLYGMPAIAATATSLFTIIPTSLSGTIAHLRYKSCIPLLGVAAGIGGACMSPMGVWLGNNSPEWAVMTVAAFVIGYSAFTMFSKALKLTRSTRAAKAAALGDGDLKGVKASGDLGSAESGGAEAHVGTKSVKSQGTEAGSEGIGLEGADSGSGNVEKKKPDALDAAPLTLAEFKAKTPIKRQIIVGFLVGLAAGIVSGYIGVGGGFIMVPMFVQILKTPMKLTSGTSLIAVIILAIPGTITNAFYGNIDWIAGIFIALGSVPGAAIGTKLLKRISEVALRYGFSAFLLVAALLLVLNQLNVF